jgi:hypothetical protein
MSTSTTAGHLDTRVLRDELAFWRPAAGRHNIAEIAVHHAYYVRSVRAQLSGQEAEAFPLEGEDWFDLSSDRMSWTDIQALVDSQQQRLMSVAAAIEAGTASSPLDEADRFNLVLGITCHAVYHAGQVQLIKRLKRA